MDFKLILTTFLSVFVAELGDKTQLATLGFAAEGKSKLAVFIGSASALVATSLIAVVFGEALSRVISPLALKRAAGVLFVVLGAWTLWQAK